MIGRYHANLTGTVAAIAGQAMQFSLVLWADQLKQTPNNLTGFTAKCTLRDVDGTLLVGATTENGGVVITGASGLIAVASGGMTPAHSAIPAGTHSYALELYNGSAVLELYITGDLTFDTDLSP